MGLKISGILTHLLFCSLINSFSVSAVIGDTNIVTAIDSQLRLHRVIAILILNQKQWVELMLALKLRKQV